MSYQPQQTPTKRRGGGGGMFLFLAIAGIAFFMFTRSSNKPAVEPDQSPRQGSEIDLQAERDSQYEIREGMFGKGDTKSTAGTNQGRETHNGDRTTNNGDWSLTEAGTQVNTPAKSNKTTKAKDGWSMEEMDSTKSSNTNINLSGSSDASAANGEPDLKKTTKGDWSAEEVDTKRNK